MRGKPGCGKISLTIWTHALALLLQGRHTRSGRNSLTEYVHSCKGNWDGFKKKLDFSWRANLIRKYDICASNFTPFVNTFDQEIELRVLRVQLKQELSKSVDQVSDRQTLRRIDEFSEAIRKKVTKTKSDKDKK